MSQGRDHTGQERSGPEKKKCRHTAEAARIAEPALSRASPEMLGKSRDQTCTERRKAIVAKGTGAEA